MIESKFEDSVSTKAVGFSHGNFRFVVQTLHYATGKQFLRPEIVEDQLPVLAQGTGDLLHGLDARAHGLPAPLVQELAGPSG